ncbi:MAG: hypothetical protein ACC663_08520 [Gammaproteobacteria bacterium]
MTKLYKSIPVFLLLLFSLPAMASQCPGEWKKIDAALAANPSLSAANMSHVKELRASGEKMHKAGKHQKALKDLAEAKKLLGI